MIMALVGSVDLKGQSLNALEAPRAVVDALRLGMLSASFETYGVKFCAQQRMMKSMTTGCPQLTKRLDIGILQNDSEWASSMETLLSGYGVSFKLPSVDCSQTSQQSFLRYVEQVKRASWTALRSQGSQTLDGKKK